MRLEVLAERAERSQFKDEHDVLRLADADHADNMSVRELCH